MTLSLPAPAAILDLVKCNCKKGCSNKCSCKKVFLSCTEICGCFDYGCKNPYNVTSNLESFIQDEDN